MKGGTFVIKFQSTLAISGKTLLTLTIFLHLNSSFALPVECQGMGGSASERATREKMCEKVAQTPADKIMSEIVNGNISTGLCKIYEFSPSEANCKYYFINPINNYVNTDKPYFGLNGYPEHVADPSFRHSGCVSKSRYIPGTSNLDSWINPAMAAFGIDQTTPEMAVRSLLIKVIHNTNDPCGLNLGQSKSATNETYTPDSLLRLNGYGDGHTYDFSNVRVDENGLEYIRWGNTFCPVSAFSSSTTPWKINLARKVRLMRNAATNAPATISSSDVGDTGACSGGSSSSAYYDSLKGIHYAMGAWILKHLDPTLDLSTSAALKSVIRSKQPGMFLSMTSNQFFMLSNQLTSSQRVSSLCFEGDGSDPFCAMTLKSVLPGLDGYRNSYRDPAIQNCLKSGNNCTGI